MKKNSKTGKRSKKRTPLDKELIISGAIDIASKRGIGAVTLRNLADELGVQAMSIYHYFDSKDVILTQMLDRVYGMIDTPEADTDWREATKLHAISSRNVLSEHSWALTLINANKKPGPATLHHHNSLLGCFRRAGFSISMTLRAVSLIDSYIYGFILQEQSLSLETDSQVTEASEQVISQMNSIDEYPYLMEAIQQHVLKGNYAYSSEFTHGLDLILVAINHLLQYSEDQDSE